MRKFTLITTVIVMLLANAVWVAKSQAQWPQSTTNDPRFSVEFGAKAYDRPGSKLALPLITDGITNSTLFDSNEATDLGSAGGAEVKFNFMTKIGREFEVRTILADWEQSAEIVGNNLRSPFFPVPGAEPTTVNFGHDSDYFSIEVMHRRAIVPGVTAMFGPRFVSTKDRLQLSGSLDVDPQDGTPIITVTQTQSYEATNALIGLQGGFEFNFPVTQSVYLNSFIRVGGYTNPTEVTTFFTDSISGIGTTNRQTKSTGSFLGEVGGRVYFDVVPNCLATYVGYEATWIDGIALAPAQVLTTGLSGIETANTPFFNALTFGVKLNY